MMFVYGLLIIGDVFFKQCSEIVLVPCGIEGSLRNNQECIVLFGKDHQEIIEGFQNPVECFPTILGPAELAAYDDRFITQLINHPAAQMRILFSQLGLPLWHEVNMVDYDEPG